jgi:SAM-dependent methyltransferase
LSQYLFDHEWESERQRLAVLEDVFDGVTVRHLRALGVPPGGRCLEVGAGAGSIASWLCQAVGPEGRVVATDLQTGFLEQLTDPNLEVRCHNIVSDVLEEGFFDVIHTRLVLEHIPERELCLKRLVAALAPGGLLVVEEFDWASLTAVAEETVPLWDEVLAAVLETMSAAGYDYHCGRRIPGLLRDAGLADVGAEGWVPVIQGPGPAQRWWETSLARLRPAVLAKTDITEDVLDRHVQQMVDPAFSFFLFTLVTAWGRRPGA